MKLYYKSHYENSNIYVKFSEKHRNTYSLFLRVSFLCSLGEFLRVAFAKFHMNKTKEEVCAETILDYLIKQNRPYSVTDVQTNLHNEFGKSAVSKALDYLSSRGKIRAKTYNKQVVYVADQNHMPTVDYSELKVMDSNILAASERIKLVNDECKILENALHQLNVEETNEASKVVILLRACIGYNIQC